VEGKDTAYGCISIFSYLKKEGKKKRKKERKREKKKEKR